MYSIEFTNKYLSDLKLARKRKLDESELNIVIEKLSSGDEPLPMKYKDHQSIWELLILSRMPHST